MLRSVDPTTKPPKPGGDDAALQEPPNCPRVSFLSGVPNALMTVAMIGTGIEVDVYLLRFERPDRWR
jgi:hypothetical protein